HTSPPVLKLSSSAVEYLSGIGCVLQRTPTASGSVIQGSGRLRSFIQELLFIPEASARCENLSQVLRQTFVHPQEISFHGLLVIGRCQSFRTAIFAVPRVSHLMWEQAAGKPALIVFNHGALAHAIIAGFMMLQSEVGYVVAQGKQEVIIAVMPRS